MPVAAATPDAIVRAVALLRSGELVAFPTETVYGLGANAFDERAVARVFDVKGRPRFDPLIVHVADLDAARQLVVSFPPAAERLASAFWAGPLTLVLPKAAIVPDLVTAGGETVAVRIPAHPVALELLRSADFPVAAPSANLFGRVSPTTAEHVREQLGERVGLILDGGPCRVGLESTVLQLASNPPVLLRPGGTTLEDIEAVIGPVALPPPDCLSAPYDALMSPGTLPQHYAPRTPLTLGSALTTHLSPPTTPLPPRVGLLTLQPPPDTDSFIAIEVLSATGDLCEAAAGFFAALRRLDALGLDLIVADSFPEQGLGRALNDRLRRAAHP